MSSHISHLETGRNLPGAAECEKLLVFYGLGDRWPFFRELLKAAKKGRDWWKAPAFSGIGHPQGQVDVMPTTWARQIPRRAAPARTRRERCSYSARA
ncbi:MAG: hypothetical protein ACRDRP_00865 [Pseudonocardiaceae bacterium]